MVKEYTAFKFDVDKTFSLFSKKNQEAINNHLRECSIKSKAKKRNDNRKRALIRFLNYLNKDYDSINYQDYISVAEAISNSKLAVHTRNGERDFIKRFLRENFNDWSTRFKQFKLLGSEQKTEEEKLNHKMLITDSEIERLIKSTSNMKYKALVITLYETAGRPEEILKLKWEDIDFKDNLVYLYSSKTKRKRAVPIKLSIDHLKRLKEEIEAKDNEYIFYSTGRDKKLCPASLNYILQILSNNAKIEKKIFPYLFRHSRLSLLITKLSPKVYEDIAGHSLQIGLKTYAHLSQDKHIKEMNEKVFEIKELSQDKEKKLENKIAELQDIIQNKVKALEEQIEKNHQEAIRINQPYTKQELKSFMLAHKVPKEEIEEALEEYETAPIIKK